MRKIQAFCDHRISFGALGLLQYIICLGLEPTASAILNALATDPRWPTPETPPRHLSKHAVRKWLRELVDAGYVEKTRYSVGGRFSWEFDVRDIIEVSP